ncbi:MAG TPA: SpoIID/LytB domain-containing protein [Oscillatoriaceae cyanobacterium]
MSRTAVIRALLGSVLLLSSFIHPAVAGTRSVRVGLLRVHPPQQLRVGSEAPWQLRIAGQTVTMGAGGTVRLQVEGNRVAAFAGPRRFGAAAEVALIGGTPWRFGLRNGARRYTGRLRISVLDGRLLPILTLPLDDYLQSVVADELPPNWPHVAIEAQAIAARSYALAHFERHGSDGYDFCDSTHCALFRGVGDRRAEVDRAVTATRGEVVLWHGRPIDAVWSAVCGGYTQDNALVFGGAERPYLRGGADRPAHGPDWCAAATWHQPWRLAVTRPVLAQALQRAGMLHTDEPLQYLRVTETGPGGLAVRVQVTGSFSRSVSGYALWMALGPSLGWGDIASPDFAIAHTGDRYVFTGRGLGHGVGLCQWGARGRALAGESVARILAAYFPGTTLSRAPED